MEKYIPDVYQKSIYAIDYSKLKEKGIKCLLFDLDNTLEPYHVKGADEKLVELFSKLKEMGFQLIIFSNSCKKRVKPFKEGLEVDCCANARKPHTNHFYRILKEYHLAENEVAIIGDQIMTDIVGGNRVGITTILVNPISVRDPFWTKPNRWLEKRVIKKLKNHDLFFKGRYYE